MLTSITELETTSGLLFFSSTKRKLLYGMCEIQGHQAICSLEVTLNLDPFFFV